MHPCATAAITDHFADLADPRSDHTKRHQLLDIITIAICAVICGADGWTDVETFGHAKETWLQTFLQLPNGIPSHDTFGRVFARLKPEPFQRAFLAWVQAVAEVTQGQVIAVDGKTLRRSHDHRLGQEAIVMVSAWATANQLVLGQTKVDDKSNEITAIPHLLELLALSGCIVTVDAVGCQPKIAAAILEGGADYLLAVKENQGQLYEDLHELFAGAEEIGFRDVPHGYHQTVGKDHGRIEIRQCWTLRDEESLAYVRRRERWPQLRSVVQVRSERRLGATVSVEDRYFISSLPGEAKEVLAAVRGHWGIENGLHW